MYMSCSTEEATRRQRQLEVCLMDNMLNKKYEDVQVMDLCKQTSISRRCFYRYFGSKEGCLEALIDHAILDWAKHKDVCTIISEKYPQDLLCFLSYWYTQKPLLDALAYSGMSTKLMERFLLYMYREEFDFRQLSHADIDGYAGEVIMFASYGLMSLIIGWHHSGYARSIIDMAAIINRLMIAPLTYDPEAK